MRSAIQLALILATAVSARTTTVAQPRSTLMVSASLTSVAALRRLKRRYPLLPQ
jgi:hypothetical protein